MPKFPTPGKTAAAFFFAIAISSNAQTVDVAKAKAWLEQKAPALIADTTLMKRYIIDIKTPPVR